MSLNVCDKDYWREVERYEIDRAKKDNALLRKLKRSTKAKFYKAITEEFNNHCFYGDFEIVSQNECNGEKVKGIYYNGESTPVKHVYSDIRCCGYDGDSYSGHLYLKIDKGRYFKMSVYS